MIKILQENNEYFKKPQPPKIINGVEYQAIGETSNKIEKTIELLKCWRNAPIKCWQKKICKRSSKSKHEVMIQAFNEIYHNKNK